MNLDVQIAVTYQNTELEAGEDAGADALQQSAQGVNGQIVTVRIPQSDVRAHTASAWVLIIVAAISAIAIGVSVALWQAQRLSARGALKNLAAVGAARSGSRAGLPKLTP